MVDSKEILRRVIQGFELVPAKQGFGHPYVTKTGAATPDLAKRITAWIKQNFPQSDIIASYEGAYKTINFRKVMAEHLVIKQLVIETVQEARSQSVTRKVRDQIVKLDPDHIRPAQNTNRLFAPGLDTKDLISKIEKQYNTKVDIIEPGKTGSQSSKFPTLTFDVDGTPVSIVHAKGIIAGAEGESKQEANIQNQLQGKKVTLYIGDKDYTNVDGFKKISGNKKADFAFTSGTKEVAFVQHKSPTHQQMSGINKFKAEGGSYMYPEMNELVKRVKEEVAKDGRLTSKVVVPITSKGLDLLAVYGDPKDKGTADFVEAYCVGDLELKETSNNVYELTAPEIYVYPKIPEGKNKPTLVATYRKGRNQDGIQDVRFGIYPESYAG